VCVAIVAVAACAKQEPEPQQTARTSDAAEATSSSEKQTSDRDAPAVPTGSADIPSGSSSAAKERALKARDALFDRLLSELTAAMFTGGPSAAIEVCSQKAPQIAASVGKEQGVAIGRTSFRLRNPANQPPEWATQFVEERVAQPQFVELEGGGTGAFLPIRLKAFCLACHGPKEHLGKDVRERLAELYPDDRATGFRSGDLRGWFWVEVQLADE
jgi:hypothetical protein